MKLLLPVRRTAMIRHWPWITFAVVAINLLSFIFFSQMDRVREQRLALRGLIALVYFQQHPYLALKAPLDEFAERNPRAGSELDGTRPNLADVSSLSRPIGGSEPTNHALIREQQAELDGKVSAFAQVAAQWNTASLGYVPRARNAWGLITYQFMHGSWLHLLGNLCFLWFVGTRLERAWGRIPFAAFYLVAGIAAASTHQLFAWHSAVPLIGASGAIAGLLGAVTLRCLCSGARLSLSQSLHWHAWRVRAHWLVVVWFAIELGRALLLPARGGSAAHFAHVGGFAFGFLGAWLMRVGGFEMRQRSATSLALD